jgi:hypothetical protein
LKKIFLGLDIFPKIFYHAAQNDSHPDRSAKSHIQAVLAIAGNLATELETQCYEISFL